jgi:hypothetical protein
MRWGQVSAEADQQDAELDRLRLELREKRAAETFDLAFTRAAAQISKEIIRELAADERGEKDVRLLSDPANSMLRNQEYVDLADKIVRKISEGRLYLTPDDKARIVGNRPLK